jgi:hypothetical protein
MLYKSIPLNNTYIPILRFIGEAAYNIAKTTSRHGEKFEKRASENPFWRKNVADKKNRAKTVPLQIAITVKGIYGIKKFFPLLNCRSELTIAAAPPHL